MTPNPVVRTTPLRSYPGWIVRQYEDGIFDARDMRGVAITPGLASFAETVLFIRTRMI